MVDYTLQAAKALQAALRKENGWRPPPKLPPQPKPPRITKAQREEERQRKLGRIAQQIMRWVGDCVPDGDPIDHLISVVEREVLGHTVRDPWERGVNVIKWLDQACRLHLHCKSYNQYLIDAWDGWNEICEDRGEEVQPNPWRPYK